MSMGPTDSGTPRGLVPVGHFGDSAPGLQETWRGRLGRVRCRRPGHFPRPASCPGTRAHNPMWVVWPGEKEAASLPESSLVTPRLKKTHLSPPPTPSPASLHLSTEMGEPSESWLGSEGWLCVLSLGMRAPPVLCEAALSRAQLSRPKSWRCLQKDFL